MKSVGLKWKTGMEGWWQDIKGGKMEGEEGECSRNEHGATECCWQFQVITEVLTTRQSHNDVSDRHIGQKPATNIRTHPSTHSPTTNPVITATTNYYYYYQLSATYPILLLLVSPYQIVAHLNSLQNNANDGNVIVQQHPAILLLQVKSLIYSLSLTQIV